MSKLLDDIVSQERTNAVHSSFDLANGKTIWMIAKPLEPSFSFRKYYMRIKDCIRILTSKSFAYHYFEDDDKFKKKEIND